MSIQFQAQHLLEEVDSLFEKIKSQLTGRGASEESAEMLANGVIKKLIDFQTAVDIVRATTGIEEMSSVGGGVTGGPAAATFTPGNGEQVASTKAFGKRKYQEDAPMLAGGKKADLHTYTQDGFTQVKEELEESRGYNQFKRQTATRSKPEQMHQAVKMIDNKLSEITKLLEFTDQMKQELSEGEETVNYNHNTKKMFGKIHSKVVEVYTKVKGLK